MIDMPARDFSGSLALVELTKGGGGGLGYQGASRNAMN